MLHLFKLKEMKITRERDQNKSWNEWRKKRMKEEMNEGVIEWKERKNLHCFFILSFSSH